MGAAVAQADDRGLEVDGAQVCVQLWEVVGRTRPMCGCSWGWKLTAWTRQGSSQRQAASRA
jgi:hypothetical protein